MTICSSTANELFMTMFWIFKLLKLGKLLRVGGSSEAETHGQVLRLVAEAALKVCDSFNCLLYAIHK